MRKEITDLTKAVKNLMLHVQSGSNAVNSPLFPATPAKSTVSPPSKTPVKKGSDQAVIKLEGIMDRDELTPIGKIQLEHESVPRVVYINRKGKKTYYSPKGDSGELTSRACTQDVSRIKALTEEEMDFLGFEYV